MTLEELNNNIQAFDIISEIDKIIKEEESVIVDTITQEQLYEKGIDGDGQSLGDYSPRSIALKKDPRIDHITLKEEGDFYAGYNLQGNYPDYQIYSKDWKAPKLERVFGSKIFELTKENQNEIVQKDIIPAITNKLQKAIS